MEFTKVADIVQLFANEWCLPGNLVLINSPELKYIFRYINIEPIVIGKNDIGDVVDIVVSGDILPFENHSFDLIVDLNGSINEEQIVLYLKSNGKFLRKVNSGGQFIDHDNFCYYLI
jgi:hypothetical protein